MREDIRGKKFLVLGMGKSGGSARRFIRKWGGKCYLVDKNAGLTIDGADTIYNENCAQNLFFEAKITAVILAPGISRRHPLVTFALKQKVEVISEIELAYRFMQGKLIAVTGTNGKTTTVTLMKDILEKSDLKVHLGGNIGIPFCDFVDETSVDSVTILELSSFQLESLKSFHPQVAVILNMTPGHGERYEQVADYFSAKLNIGNNLQEKDLLIAPQDVLLQCTTVPAQKIEILTESDQLLQDDLISKIDLNTFSPKGAHNLINLFASLYACQPFVQNWDGAKRAIAEFGGIDYRLQFLSPKNNIRPINDAKSTNWEATKAAVNTAKREFPDISLHLILGGKKRGDGDELAPHLPFLKKNCDQLFLFGETAFEHYQELQNSGIRVERFIDLPDLCRFALKADKQSILLFSPAFPSFDQYTSYIKRGEQFTLLMQ